MSRTVLHHAVLLTVDDKNSFYPDGCIVIEEGQIVYVGPNALCPVLREDDQELDFSGKLVMPGLINTHIHTHSPLFRNLGEGAPLDIWLNKIMWPAESFLTEEAIYYAALHTCIESIASGVTTFADQFYFTQTVAKAVSESGLRALLCASIFANGKTERCQTVQTAADFVDTWKGRNALIMPGLGPHAPYSVAKEQWLEIVQVSQAQNVMIHTHVSETMKENMEFLSQYGRSPTQWLDDLGVLERPTLAAHCVHVSKDDITILKQRNVYVSYNPVSNLKLVSGIMPYADLTRAGVQVSMGTDGAQSNNTLDLLQDLKTGVLLQKEREHDAAFLPVSEAIRLVTISGAKALGLERRIGSLEPGKDADIIAINLEQPHLQPFVATSADSIYTALVYCASGKDVTDTMVAGRWLMRDRHIVELNVTSILAHTNALSRSIRAQAGLL